MKVTKRVLLLVTNSDLAGAPLHVLSIAKNLRIHGPAPLLVCGGSGALCLKAKEAQLDLVSLPSLATPINPVNDLRALYQIYVLAKKYRPDILHVHSSKAALLGRLASLLLRTPVLYTVHGWGFGPGRPGLQSRILKIFERTLKPLTASYICVSAADEEQARQCLNITSDLVRTIHNGVPDTYPPRPRRSVEQSLELKVLVVARAGGQKDHATLVRALDGLPVHLTLIGGGTDDPQFKSNIQELYSNIPNVSFLGERDDVESFFAHADLFILPSLYEGLPYVIIEAMRAGLPVIASNVGGVRELVADQETGFLVAPADPGSLRNAVKYYLEHPPALIDHGNVARKKYQQSFSEEKMIESLFSAYREL